MHARIGLALFLLASWSPDEMILKNGDRITGTLVHMIDGRITFRTDHSAEITTDWSQVKEVTTGGPVRVRLSTETVLEGPLAPGEAGRMRIGDQAVDMDRIVAINEPPDAWRGSVNAAARKTDGNTHTSDILLTAEAYRTTGSGEVTMKGTFRYGERSGRVTERNSYALGRYRHLLDEEIYAYGSLEAFSDTFKDLDLRLLASVGAGALLHRNATWEASIEAGLAYVDNRVRTAEDESHMGARLALTVRAALPLGLDFSDAFSFYPNFEETPDWQIHNEAAISTALGEGWTLKLGVITDIDNRTPPGIEERDDVYFLGLGYTF